MIVMLFQVEGPTTNFSNHRTNIGSPLEFRPAIEVSRMVSIELTKVQVQLCIVTPGNHGIITQIQHCNNSSPEDSLSKMLFCKINFPAKKIILLLQSTAPAPLAVRDDIHTAPG